MSKPKQFTAIIDTREQSPYDLPNSERAALKTGDYSIKGMEQQITIERKTKSDAYGTIGAGRKRFTKELERMKSFDYAAIIVECSMKDFVEHPPKFSKLAPKSAINSLLAWSVRYGVHVFFCDNRTFATVTCYRLLEKYYNETNK